ncbi:SUKH-4 family immunity protein [Streptomyces sp. PKU-EA00015]|uniref:SUKH-4 family immunity protein n=1 Tax=Streptomyces sp. PKU-EA00015 TaxID=2748326 RepID=UPI0017B6957D|nr:SUKH-4 family immunity protein [Streptomyces sp. PKU-EA00015]NWF29410.1 SUKH-4 family immunity protein [Streptomyces sp. PKU-EA00015]
MDLSDLVESFGLDGFTIYPRIGEHSTLPAEAAGFLSRVGLPNDDVFLSQTDPEDEGATCSHHVGAWADRTEKDVPTECRGWLLLGYFPYAVAALDPSDGKVYSFSDDGEGNPVAIHRDVESLVRSLLILKKFMREREDDVDLSPDRMKAEVEAVEPLAFLDEDSPWSHMHFEMSDGIF